MILYLAEKAVVKCALVVSLAGFSAGAADALTWSGVSVKFLIQKKSRFFAGFIR